MKNLIIQNQRLEQERDKYRTKYRGASSEKWSYKKLVDEKVERIKMLELENLGLRTELSSNVERFVKLENDVASLSAELSQKNAEIQEYKNFFIQIQTKLGNPPLPKDGVQDIHIINNGTIENFGVSKSDTKIEKLETDNVNDINNNDIVKLHR